MKFSHIAILIVSIIMSTACAAQTNPIASPQMDAPTMNVPSTAAPSENQISSTGTVCFQEMEGGFWCIIDDDGVKYDPMQLSPAFQKEGLRVRFTASPETDMMSTHMWGMIIKLSHIEAIK